MNTKQLAFALVALTCGCTRALPPAPYGPVPTAAQLEWQKMEYYMFAHFGPNTFTDVEWGDGLEDPSVFNPSDLDCRQWAATAAAAGMKGIIVTAKHHDGFCLWPSSYSSHTVRESSWRNGTGDVLAELSEACREYGLKFGVYLSPWDRNHPAYGTPEYNSAYAGALGEALSGYGEVWEQWLDGACGEGPDGKRQVYDWPLFFGTIGKHQPQAVIFSDIGPGCRWIGNERGVAGETNWSRLDTEGFAPGHDSPGPDTLNRGNIYGQAWVPGEVDVSIRPGWFYSPSTDTLVKPLAALLDIYYTSVGRNANLLLNVPPDRRGRIHPADSARLMELRAALDATFADDLARGASVTASSSRGRGYEAARIVDGDYDTCWATDDGTLSATLTITLPRTVRADRLVLQEYVPLGQRVAQFSVEFFDGATWLPLAEGTTIGYKRILRFPAVETDRLRVNILRSLACPVLNNIGLYLSGEQEKG
ncbi:MAG: alpha-L-fucosidase [Rikenellaceae bacterium]|nr:alpha-L-fucosidase [Rikenellaceae bacterium]